MKLSHAVIIRFHYQQDNPKVGFRLAYFQSMVLPRLLNQTRQDFDIWIRCYPWHKEILESMSPRIKTFSIKGEDEKYISNKERTYFYDFVPWNTVVGMPMYDIQTGIDSDDLVREDFIERIEQEIEKNGYDTSLHICFQPYLFDTKSLFQYTMGVKYTPRYGSAFLSLYQPDKSNYVFINNVSHLQLYRYASKSIVVPEGYCWASCHDNNESTKVNDNSVIVVPKSESVETQKQQIIPKIIHQIWVGDTEAPIERMKTWKNHNPDYEHIIWDEKAIEALPLKNKRLYDIFKSQGLYYGMADIARVEILEKYGGIYIDADTICIKPLNKEWLTKEFVCCYSPETNDRVANGMMMSIPNHRVLQQYLRALSSVVVYSPVWKTVGSGLLTPIVKGHLSQKVIILPAYYFFPTTKDGQKLSNYDKAYCHHFYQSSIKKNTIKAVWSKLSNFGDTLTPHVVKFFTGKEVERVSENTYGKLVGIGSIMTYMRDTDVLFGTGIMYPDKRYQANDISVIAVRGPKTRELIDTNVEIPEVYGDAGLLLPLMYNPEVEPIYDVGYIPHYVDKDIVFANHNLEEENAIFIDLRPDDISSNWKQVVDQVKKCKKIVSSSLHGIILGEAYGIPTVWEQYSDKINGGDFKYQDYFLGTGRKEQEKGVILDPIPDLYSIQKTLVDRLKKHYE